MHPKRCGRGYTDGGQRKGLRGALSQESRWDSAPWEPWVGKSEGPEATWQRGALPRTPPPSGAES